MRQISFDLSRFSLHKRLGKHRMISSRAIVHGDYADLRWVVIVVAWLCAIAAGALAAETGSGTDPWFERQDVCLGGADGYHTYRLPVLVCTPKGTVLLFCDGRKFGSGDLGKIDPVLKRSTDGGRTWGPLQVLQTDPGEKTKIGNFSAVFERQTGQVLAVFCRDLVRAFCVASSDEGVTFRQTEITDTFRRLPMKWEFFATGHVHGIQTAQGRLVLPIFLCDVPRTQVGRGDHMRAGVIYSDDHGKTWQPGGLVDSDLGLNESTVFEAPLGSLCLNSRASKLGYRVAARSADGGLTWSEARTDESLYDSTCQAATLAFDSPEGKRLVLFCNPAGKGRKHLTVRLSPDGGKTWPVAKTVEPGPAGYSDMTVTPEGIICVAYENGQRRYSERITVARFNLAWLCQ